MRCKHWDCGWCYCRTGNSNDINGMCMAPNECEQLRLAELESAVYVACVIDGVIDLDGKKQNDRTKHP